MTQYLWGKVVNFWLVSVNCTTLFDREDILLKYSSFPKVDHFANLPQSLDYWINCWIKFLLKICQRFDEDMVNIYQIFGKVSNDPLHVLSGNEQDLGRENIVNTYLFYQVCKVHGTVCFGDQFANAEKKFYVPPNIWNGE